MQFWTETPPRGAAARERERGSCDGPREKDSDLPRSQPYFSSSYDSAEGRSSYIRIQCHRLSSFCFRREYTTISLQ